MLCVSTHDDIILNLCMFIKIKTCENVKMCFYKNVYTFQLNHIKEFEDFPNLGFIQKSSFKDSNHSKFICKITHN